MLSSLRERLAAARRRAYRLERRELRQFRAWLGETSNLLHLSVLLFVPLLTVLVTLLANLTETIDARCETRVSRSSIETFLERNDAHYDVVFLGASSDRSVASKFFSRPTYERIQNLETDVAVVHIP